MGMDMHAPKPKGRRLAEPEGLSILHRFAELPLHKGAFDKKKFSECDENTVKFL